MILVVSAITWTEQELDLEGNVIVLPHPTFELSDGWYRIQVEVDEALARAARNRKIRLGTKLVIVGAKVSLSSLPCGPLRTSSDSGGSMTSSPFYNNRSTPKATPKKL